MNLQPAAGSAHRSSRNHRRVRVVPLHWTTLLGVISLSCFVVLAVTGVVLLYFFEPSTNQITYTGSYPLLRGVQVSEAYASTLDISLEVPGGLLVRQAHHWAALVLPASLMLQMLSTFFTGGFRRPRQWSWVLLVVTFLVTLAGGWSGYGLPDDQLSGTGLRIADGIVRGIPFIGGRLSLLLLGGEFPGMVIERMYWLHVAAVPGTLVAVMAIRLRLAARRIPAQLPGRGSEDIVVGLPLRSVVVRAIGLFFISTGVLTAMAGVLSVNPVWKYGPSSTAHASSGSQPDWYLGFLDGSLRLVPSGWEVPAFGGTVAVGLLLPQAIAGGFLTVVLLWPFLEAKVTGDHRRHHVLDRPRDRPSRTAFGVAGIVLFAVMWGAGATDLVTTQFSIAFEHQVRALRILVFVGPLLAYGITRQICLALVAREADTAAHGYETGIVVRSPSGGYTEIHAPLSNEDVAAYGGDLVPGPSTHRHAPQAAPDRVA